MANNSKDDLDNAAYDVADEYRDGKLLHSIPKLSEAWAPLVAELERRCPGFTEEEYSKALNDGFVSSR